jgi:hypothetical protein
MLNTQCMRIFSASHSGVLLKALDPFVYLFGESYPIVFFSHACLILH